MTACNVLIDIKVRFKRSLIVYNYIRTKLGLGVHVPKLCLKTGKPYFKATEK